MQHTVTDQTKSFRVGSSFAMPDVIRSMGHSPEAVFAAAGVDPDLYSHPENRIAAEDLGRLFLQAARVTSREDIGLLVVSEFRPPGLGLVGLLKDLTSTPVCAILSGCSATTRSPVIRRCLRGGRPQC